MYHQAFIQILVFRHQKLKIDTDSMIFYFTMPNLLKNLTHGELRSSKSSSIFSVILIKKD